MGGVGPRLCGIGDEAAADLHDQIRIHAELGLAGIELRTVNGRGAHQWTASEAEHIAGQLAEAGLEVPVVDTPVGGWAVTIGSDFDAELAVLRRAAENALIARCRRLRVMSYPNDGRTDEAWRACALWRLRELTTCARDLGVTLLHENCVGWAAQDAASTLDMVRDVAGLGLIFDAGNGLAYGYDGVEYLRAVLEQVEHVHVKDGIRRGDDVVFGLPGDGEADLAGCVQLLAGAGFDGWYSLEPHVAYLPHRGVSRGPQDREQAYRACAERFRALLDAHAVTSA